MTQFKKYARFYWKLVSKPWVVISRMVRRMLSLKTRRYSRLVAISMFLLVIEAAGVTSTMHEREMVVSLNDNMIKRMDLSVDNLITVMKYYDIKHPEIVLAQAILETGWFQSDNCKKHNNLFGLYNSKRKNFYKFKHWSDSVKAYSSMIQYRYNTGDYYAWLNKIGYAEDRSYTTKLKGLVKRENLKKRVNGEV